MGLGPGLLAMALTSRHMRLPGPGRALLLVGVDAGSESIGSAAVLPAGRCGP